MDPRAYINPVTSGNGKLKPLTAQLNGQPTQFKSGVYFLRYLRDGKRVYEAVGSDPQRAMLVKAKRERILAAQAAGVEIADENPSPAPTHSIKEAIAEYLADVKALKARRTHLLYALTLQSFLESLSASTQRGGLEAITRKDILTWMAALRGRITPRTVANYVSFLRTFFTAAGVPFPLIKSDKVRFTEKAVSAYSAEEIRLFLAQADQEETDLIQFLLCTGAREQEVMFATWRDVDFHGKTFTVTEKLDLKYTPKDHEEGAIPIPDSLVDLLKARRQRFPRTRLIFPMPDGKPNGHLLRIVKGLALSAGLNCGECHKPNGECCSTSPRCDQIGLHRFRKTFATMHHESGVPVRTIQRWLRHSANESAP